MRFLFSLTLAFLLPSAGLYAQATVLPAHFYKHMQGSIAGKQPIMMDLVRNDSLLEGSYYLLQDGMLISVRGEIDKTNHLTLIASKDTMKKGTFQGRFISDKEIEGQWEPAGTGGKQGFALLESYPPGSAKMNAESMELEYPSQESKQKATFNAMQLQIISGAPKAAMDSINANLRLEPEDKTSENNLQNLKAAGQEFFDDFDNDMKNSNGQAVNYDFHYSQKVMYNSRDILSMEVLTYQFTGGAHGISGIETFVFSLKDGHQMDIDEIFKEDYDEDAISAIVEKRLRQQFNIPAAKKLSADGFLTDDLDASDNFYLTAAGITFVYNPYEIAPYSMGEIDVFVPYSDLKSLLQAGVLPFGK